MTSSQPSGNQHLRDELLQVLNSYMLSQCLYTVAKLGIADLLRDGAKSCGSLARACHVEPEPLYRVLRAVSSISVFRENASGQFEMTPKAELLCRDHPSSLKAWAIMRGEKFCWQPYGSILETVRSGKPAFNLVFGQGPFEHFSQNASDSRLFNEAMRSISTHKFQAVSDAFEFPEDSLVVDVGGGSGGLLASILKRRSSLKGLLCDLPHVIAEAETSLRASGLDDRCKCLAVDMFEEVPRGGDFYLMANVIHDWSDELSLKILKNCRAAMTEEAHLLLIEMILPERNETDFSILVDIEMLVMTQGGRERTVDQYRQLFSAAGFSLTQIIPTEGPWSLIEGRPV